MPELPEVETVVRSVAPHLVGRRIVATQFTSKFVTPGSRAKLSQRLAGRQRIKQGFDWNARSVEARRTADAFGIDPNKTEQWMPRLDQISDEMLWGNWSNSRDQRSIDELGHSVETLKVIIQLSLWERESGVHLYLPN